MGYPERNEHQGNGDERGGVLHYVEARRAVAAGLVRLNHQSGARKLTHPEERDREKVRHLPQEQGSEEEQPRNVDNSRGRDLSDERRDRSGNRTHEKRCRRAPLERRVHEDVGDECDGRQHSCQ